MTLDLTFKAFIKVKTEMNSAGLKSEQLYFDPYNVVTRNRVVRLRALEFLRTLSIVKPLS